MNQLKRRKLQNLLHSVILIAGMGMIAAGCAWTLWGFEGVLWALVTVILGLVITPSLPPEMVLSFYRARPLSPGDIPELHDVLARLSARAELPAPPRLYYVPSAMTNAFAVGQPREAAIALTDGMLRALSLREIAAVMAHEVSHIANNDLWLMNLADSMSRLTTILSYIGIFLLAMNLPLILSGAVVVPWLLIGLLMLAPTLLSLMQLALSRAREYDADLEAARLSGDPQALASALAKLERSQGGLWENFMPPGRGLPEPSLLRSHPPTRERIRRLQELKAEGTPPSVLQFARNSPRLPRRLPRITRAPRWRWPGLWY